MLVNYTVDTGMGTEELGWRKATDIPCLGYAKSKVEVASSVFWLRLNLICIL